MIDAKKNTEYVIPYWRLSSIYFSYFAVVGSLMPFWGLYLQTLGFDARQIATLIAIPLVTKVIGPNLWGWLADRSQKPLLVIRLGALGASVLFFGLTLRVDYAALCFLIAAYSFFWNAILPQFEVVTLSHLRDQPHKYGRIRLWGSISFILAVLGLGVYFDYYPLTQLPIIVSVFMFGIFLTTCAIPNTQPLAHSDSGTSFIATLKKPVVLIFFLVCFLLQMSHGVYYVFYSIYLESYGYSHFIIAFFWAVGVIAEIFIFLKMPQLFYRFSIYQLLCVSLVLTAARWIGTGLFPQQPFILIGLQLLHAFSFGVTHAVAIETIRRAFSVRSQNQGQAFYSAFSFGGGAALGTYLSGPLWLLNANTSFWIMSLPALVGLILTVMFLKHFLSKDFLCVKRDV